MKTKNQKSIYSQADIKLLDIKKIPKHIAFIPDGNRRWAKKNHLPVKMGHHQGVKTLAKILKAAAELKIQTITTYAFSTENWNRSKEEVDNLMYIFQKQLEKKKKTLINEGVKISVIGEINAFSNEIKDNLEDLIYKTRNN